MALLAVFGDKMVGVLQAIDSAMKGHEARGQESSIEESTSPGNLNKLSEADVGQYVTAFARVSPIVLQMIIVRTADNFTSYLSEIIRECLRAQPKLLRSKETITYEEILDVSDLDELRMSLVDRKVNDLAYLGFEKLSKWFDERLGISELQTCVAWQTLVELMETRNCIVHNCCRASTKYLRAIGGEVDRRKLGEPIAITSELAFLSYCATFECVTLLDKAIAEKFGLPMQALVPVNQDDPITLPSA